MIIIGQIGTTYWITGLAGAGKSTVGGLLYKRIKSGKANVVLLDGDEIRAAFPSGDYSMEGRLKVTYQMGRLAKMLNGQDIDCVCCIVGMIDECRRWNRENIQNYVEIYVKVPIEELIRRDQKGLYSRALRGEIGNVWGVDLPVEEPKSADVVLDNGGSRGVDEIFAELVSKLKNI